MDFTYCRGGVDCLAWIFTGYLMNIIDVIMSAGKASVDVALYTLIPVMVVMLIVMKYLEAKGVVDAVVRLTAPVLKPLVFPGSPFSP